MRAISEADNRTPFASLDMPVLVLAGDLDKTVPKALTEGLIAAVPKGVPSASVHYLPGVAHAPYMEDAERYNKLLSDFLLLL